METVLFNAFLGSCNIWTAQTWADFWVNLCVFWPVLTVFLTGTGTEIFLQIAGSYTALRRTQFFTNAGTPGKRNTKKTRPRLFGNSYIYHIYFVGFGKLPPLYWNPHCCRFHLCVRATEVFVQAATLSSNDFTGMTNEVGFHRNRFNGTHQNFVSFIKGLIKIFHNFSLIVNNECKLKKSIEYIRRTTTLINTFFN
jgi:hypothetical protein